MEINIYWYLSAFFLCLGIREWTISLMRESPLKGRREIKNLKRVTDTLQELEDMLRSGTIPPESYWIRVKNLYDPWGTIISESFFELRQNGSEILPTARRLKELSFHQGKNLKEGFQKSAQSLVQAVVCLILIPLLALALSWLLPSLLQNPIPFLGLMIAALSMSGAGALWIISLGTRARWGGLTSHKRHWPFFALISGEKLLASIKSGISPDQAWLTTLQSLARDAPDLAEDWGFGLWNDTEPLTAPANTNQSNKLGALIQDAGTQLRRTIQSSMLEGRPSLEALETTLMSIRSDISLCIDQELSLLGGRTLKPLFVCVAPAMLGLLFGALALGLAPEIEGALL